MACRSVRREQFDAKHNLKLQPCEPSCRPSMRGEVLLSVITSCRVPVIVSLYLARRTSRSRDAWGPFSWSISCEVGTVQGLPQDAAPSRAVIEASSDVIKEMALEQSDNNMR